MKKALVSYQGFISKIVEPGQDGEIYEGPDASMAWIDVPDNCQMEWTLEWSPSRQQMVLIEREGPYTNNEVARRVAYGEPGQQLGMIFDAIKTHGVLDTNSDWYQHQLLIKGMIPRPDPSQNEMETLEEKLARALVEEPSADKPHAPSTQDLQSWKRFPGWKGYDRG